VNRETCGRERGAFRAMKNLRTLSHCPVLNSGFIDHESQLTQRLAPFCGMPCKGSELLLSFNMAPMGGDKGIG
jgi:hypothetical protein